MVWRGLAIAAILLALAPASRAAAQGETQLTWSDEWRPFDTPEYIIAGSLLVLSGVARLALGVASSANFRGGVHLVDDPFRDALRAETIEGRERADLVSDILWHFTQTFPSVVDVLLVAWLIRDSFDVAWQMMWMNIEAFAAVAIVVEASHLFVGRERPSGHDCDEDEEYDALCRGRGRYASFFSGHTAMAFTGAGLTCAHHLYQPLYGSRAADIAACIGTLATAATTAVLRIVADRHYFSDVVLSMILGLGAGFLLPVLLHYEAGAQ